MLASLARHTTNLVQCEVRAVARAVAMKRRVVLRRRRLDTDDGQVVAPAFRMRRRLRPTVAAVRRRIGVVP